MRATTSNDCLVLPEELDSDHARKVAELEQATQHKLKEQQKIHEEAFKHDMQRYLSTGYLQLQGEVQTGNSPVKSPSRSWCC